MIPQSDLYRLLNNLIGADLKGEGDNVFGDAFRYYMEHGWTLHFDPDERDRATMARIAAGEFWEGVGE